MNEKQVLDQFLSDRIGHPISVKYFFGVQVNDEQVEAQLAFRTTEDEYYIFRIGRQESLSHMLSFDQCDVYSPDKHLNHSDYVQMLKALPEYSAHSATYEGCRYFFVQKMLKNYREPKFIGRYRAARAFDTDCYVIQDIRMEEAGHKMNVVYRDLSDQKQQSVEYVFSDPLIFTNHSLRNVAIVKYLSSHHPKSDAKEMYRNITYLGDQVEFMDGGNIIPIKHPQEVQDIWDKLEKQVEKSE